MSIRLQKLLSFLIVLTPLLEPYRIGSVTLDTFALLISVCIGLSTKTANLNFKYGAKPFFIYALLVPNIIAISYGYIEHIPSSITVLVLYILMYTKVFPSLSFSYLMRKYKLLIYVVCIVFIIQEFMYASLGYRFVAMIPFLDVKYPDMSMASFIYGQMYYPRSSSFFLEPAHMAHFILPYLAYSLGKNSSGLSLNKYIEPILLTSILFILRSGCGVIGASAIWLLYLIHVDLPGPKKVIFFSIGLLIASFTFNKLASTEIGTSLLDRSSEIEVGGDYERSGTIRIFRGYYVYGAMNFIQQLFGVGTGGSVNVIEQSPYFKMFFGTERYLNNIQMFLVGFGMIGTMLFSFHFRKLFKANNLSGKLVLIAFLSTCFLESFFMTSKMIIYFILAFHCKEQSLNKRLK